MHRGGYKVSIVNSFDNLSEEIIKPCQVVRQVENFPETVVVTFSKKVLDALLKMNGARRISEVDGCYDLTPIYKINYKGKELAVYKSMIGGPASAGILEEVIAKGGGKFLFFGSCGTLDKQISAGRLIVPTAAYRDEGTSYHYIEQSDFIEVQTAEKLGSILSGIGIPNLQAKTWTTDAFYRETRKNMLLRKEAGCLTVEMECASVAAVCRFRNTEFYQFLYTEDNLDSAIWERRIMGSLTSEDSEKYLTIALEAAIRI